jgi:hypothetical protein
MLGRHTVALLYTVLVLMFTCIVWPNYIPEYACLFCTECMNILGGTQYLNWLRHYATSQKVAGSSPDEMDFLTLPNSPSRIMALGSTQPLTEMSTRNFPGG